MATSSVEICNDALILVGATMINDLSDDTKEAILCNEQYAKARDQLLSSHPWNFAITRYQASADADLPTGWEDGEWAYAFTLPSDVLRILDIDTDSEWAKEGEKLFTDYDPVFIKYIAQITDTTIYSKHFEKALAHELAVKICYALTQSATAVQALSALRDSAVAEARSLDAQEGSTRTVGASDFIDSRQ